MADEYELDTWRETFNLFDKKGNGLVESCMIGEIMRALGSNPSQAEVAKIIKDIDPTGDKEISFEELVPFMNKPSEKKTANDFTNFCEGFKVFDRENNGMVSVAEIRNILMAIGDKLSAEEADVLLKGMEDDNGQINYEEFVRTVMDG